MIHTLQLRFHSTGSQVDNETFYKSLEKCYSMEDKSIFRKAFSSSKEKKSDAINLPSAGVVSSRNDTIMRSSLCDERSVAAVGIHKSALVRGIPVIGPMQSFQLCHLPTLFVGPSTSLVEDRNQLVATKHVILCTWLLRASSSAAVAF